MVTKIHHTGFIVSDIEKLLPFYRDILGMEVVADLGVIGGPVNEAVMGIPGSEVKIVMLQMGGQTVEFVQLVTPPGQPIPDDAQYAKVGRSHIAFEVDDIKAIYKRLEEKGIRFVCPPQQIPGMTFFYLRDPEGLWVEMVQRLD